MTRMARHLGPDDLAVGIDLASERHLAVVLDGRGRRLARFNIQHSIAGLKELLQRTRPGSEGRVAYAFEATGHVWEAVAHFLEGEGAEYWIVNPLATHRLREARQLDRDKRDVTDAEQVAEMLRTGLVTQTRLDPPAYVELRRLWGEYARLRRERARLKTLVKHQLFGLFPELNTVWKDIFSPGALSILRLGLTPVQIAALPPVQLYRRARRSSRGRRVWRYKIYQVRQYAALTVASPRGAEALAAEIRRVAIRADLLGEQMESLGAVIQEKLQGIPEAPYLATLPGIGWVTVAGLIAEIGPIAKYQHGRQLVKLAGINPSRCESGAMVGRTTMTRRGRPGLRAVVYMATVSSLRHNVRLRAYYERLLQRPGRSMAKMQALGACMAKFLLYAFAVMKKKQAFDIDHSWEETQLRAA